MKHLLLATTLLASLFSLSAATETFHLTIPLSEKGTLKLDNINGSVEIVAWDKPEISIDAVKEARSTEALEGTQIKVSNTADEVTVHTVCEKKFLNFKGGCSVNYRISVPSGVSLKSIESVNGSIKVSGTSGDIKLETVNGRITASDLQGNAHLETVNGSIHATVTILPAGSKLHLETVNGSCELALPADAGAKLTAETVNGNVSCQLPISDSLHKKSKLHGNLGNASASIKMESVNGSLSINKR